MSDGPRMSVVLVTDRYETIRGVVRRFGAQTVAGELEVVLVAPSSAGLTADPEDVAPFHGHRLVEVDDIYPLWLARAAGVRVSTAPIVTVGETHALPRSDWAATVLAAFDAGRAAVVPGFTNGNPDGAISWSNLIVDYGRWSRALPAGEVGASPAYNAIFSRPILEALGERLDALYSPGFDAAGAVRAQGHAVWFQPSAVLYHINVSRRWAWIRERVVVSRVQAAERSRGWGRGRRLAYMGGSPLIVPLLMRRVWPGLRAARGGEELPRLTFACLIVGLAS